MYRRCPYRYGPDHKPLVLAGHGAHRWSGVSLDRVVAPAPPRDDVGARITYAVLYWGALLVAVQLVYLLVNAGRINFESAGLVILLLLALTTFVQGIYADSRFFVGPFSGPQPRDHDLSGGVSLDPVGDWDCRRRRELCLAACAGLTGQ